LKSIGETGAVADDSAEAELPKIPDSAHPPPAPVSESGRVNPANPESVDDVKPLRIFSREQETAYMNRVIDLVGGDKEQAAILLGVSLATLYRKLTEEEKVQ